MNYVRLSDMSYPYTAFQVRDALRPTILPSAENLWDPAEIGYAPIAEPNQPAYDPITQQVVAGPVQQVDGQWTNTWIVQDLPADQVAANRAAQIDQAQYDIFNAVMWHMDAAAALQGYRSIESAAIHAAWQGPFTARGQAYAIWMDACLQHAEQAIADMRSGARTVPTGDQVVAELPALQLPS